MPPATLIKARPALWTLTACLLFSQVHAKVGKDVFKKAQETIEKSFASAQASVREKAAASLADMQFPQDTALLQAAIKDKSEYVRLQAALSLSKKGDSSGAIALQEILENTPYPTGSNPMLVQFQAIAVSSMRAAAARAMGNLEDPRLMPVLKRARQDKDARVRDAAAVALAKRGDRTEIVVFNSALKDEDNGVRQAAMEALAEIASPESRQNFIDGLRDGHGAVRAAAALGLQRINAADAWRDLAAQEKDDNALVREKAAETLGIFGKKEALPILKRLADDENGFVRIAGAKSLALLGDASGAGFLKDMLGSTDTDLRARAIEALGVFPDEKDWAAVVPVLDDREERVRLAAAVVVWKKGLLR